MVIVERRSWRPSQQQWVDDDGTTWTRRKPRWLDERQARRLVMRPSTLVAVERQAGAVLVWLGEATARRQFWTDQVVGHVEDPIGSAGVEPNADGVIYRASSWTDDAGRRLILLSGIC